MEGPVGPRKRIFNEEEIEFIKNNVGKMNFVLLAKTVHIGVTNLRNFCLENNINYPGSLFKDWEDQILLDNIDLTYQEICDNLLPHRTKYSIGNRSKFLKIKKQREWSEEDVDFLRNNYSTLSMESLIECLPGCDSNTIYQKASKLNLPKRLIMSHGEYCDYIKNNSQIIVIDGVYTGFNNCFLTFKCLKHDYVWTSNSRSVFHTLRCPRCHINKKRNNADFIEEIQKNNSNIELLSEFINSNTEIRYRCLIHDQIFITRAKNLLRGHGCWICAKSKGERIIECYLIENKINYIPQKYFDDLRGVKNGVLKFDFCIMDNSGNIYKMIEFQGELHFKSVDALGGDDGLALRQFYDISKKDYCKINNIYLLEIKYDKIKDIKGILEKELNPLLKKEENIGN
jgi:hypothetical protein